jgi:hypothetical protein
MKSAKWIAILSACVLFGCGVEQPGESTEPLETASHEIRIGNSLRPQALALNALTANRSAIVAMISNPLSTTTYETVSPLRTALADPRARELMTYVASCALPPGGVVKWRNPWTAAIHAFRGGANLCPDWAYGPASSECTERVSACVLARVNARGARVSLSMRGEKPSDNSVFRLLPEISTDPLLPNVAATVTSMQSCSSPIAGVARNCGWSAEKVGRCTPGARVSVGGGGVPPSSCGGAPLGRMLSGDMVLRVCDGLSACDALDRRWLGHSEGSCGSILPAVSFTCPSSGTFAAMSAPYVSSWTGAMEIAALSGNYPATEAEVYPLSEGAFYGTLFDPWALADGVNVFVDAQGVVHGNEAVVKGSIYRRMFACMSPEWDTADAYATQRLCLLEGENCLATNTGLCTTSCEVQDGLLVPGDGDVEQCKSPDGALWLRPVSTYLNHS